MNIPAPQTDWSRRRDVRYGRVCHVIFRRRRHPARLQ